MLTGNLLQEEEEDEEGEEEAEEGGDALRYFLPCSLNIVRLLGALTQVREARSPRPSPRKIHSASLACRVPPTTTGAMHRAPPAAAFGVVVVCVCGCVGVCVGGGGGGGGTRLNWVGSTPRRLCSSSPHLWRAATAPPCAPPCP